ncbi:MAG: hypothetical protein ACYSO4_04875 [Planctomycetota bacterium]|jgi:hypothetical protein
MDIIRRAAKQLEYHMQVWSAGRGIRDGFYPVLSVEDNNHNIADGLSEFANGPTKSFYVMLDAAEHVKSALSRRLLRDAIHRIELNKSILVLIDSEDSLPEIIKSYARPFELSLPSDDTRHTAGNP